MSHVATVDMVFKDLNCLARAAARCGLRFMENQRTYKWWGRWVNDYHDNDAAYKNGIPVEDYGKCLHALQVADEPGAYEVGIVARRDGKEGYNIIFDFVDQRLMSRIGTVEISPVTGKPIRTGIKNANRLRQYYVEEVATQAAQAKGFQVLRTETPEGKILLRAVRGASSGGLAALAS